LLSTPLPPTSLSSILQKTRVAVLEHRGDPALVPHSVRRFVEWRRQAGLSPNVSATFNVFHDNPEDTPSDAYRLDICAAIQGAVRPNPSGIIEKLMIGCRCARMRHVGSDETLAGAINFLYGTWLPGSGEEPGDSPLFIQRLQLFPDVTEGAAAVDIFLPLR
jgi:AraC family transcriptional regulator